MPKILLIQNNSKLCKTTKELLQLSRYEIITAKNGKEGLYLAEEELPDLIIGDISTNTPDALDNYGILKILQKNEMVSHIPFIFIGAKKWKNADFRKAMELGAADYLTKPLNESELMNSIETQIVKLEIFKRFIFNGVTKLTRYEKGNNTDFLKSLLAQSEIRLYSKNEYICKENDYPKSVYYINKGGIKIYKPSEYGKDLIYSVYSKGDFFGIVPLFYERYYLNAVAMEDSEVILIPKDDFFNLIYNDARAIKKIILAMTNELSEREEQLIKFAYYSVRKKVAEALIILSIKYNSENEEFPDSISISRKDLSDLSGVALETAIRTLSDFKDEKIIEIKAGKIKILNFDKLKNMPN